jgi:hypothetical protein
MNLSEVQQLGRAKNAISAYLDRRLSVPKIYMDADWDGGKVDVLAIDRAGVGDAYIVTLLAGLFEVNSDSTVNALCTLMDTSLESQFTDLLGRRSQFRYVAQLAHGISKRNLPELVSVLSEFTDGFAEDGIGRVGVLFIDTSGGNFEVYEVVKAERFRSTKEILELTDKFVISHTADMEYRDPIYDQEVSA